MKVLVACEFSGVVRDAFIAEGHDAISCDLLPTESLGPHIQGDVRELLREPWDLVIAHPPCTYLTNARPSPVFGPETQIAVSFFQACLQANALRVAVENPTMFRCFQELVGKPSIAVEPYQFGDEYKKRTCWWLKGLPPLLPTHYSSDTGQAVSWIHTATGVHHGRKMRHEKAKGAVRARNNSYSFAGMAAAMAKQWGNP